MNVFDIIGPIMIGPSSSHTAGAVRIGRTSRELLGETPARAEIGLAGSFAETYKGHGTDKALVAGILGLRQDDERIRDSLALARDAGLEFSFARVKLGRAHPNTAVVRLVGDKGGACSLRAASVGGGNILVTELNGMETDFSGDHDTLIIPHRDVPGIIARVTALVAGFGVNIGNFRLNRPDKGFQAVMTIEVDGDIEPDLVARLRELPDVVGVVFLRKCC